MIFDCNEVGNRKSAIEKQYGARSSEDRALASGARGRRFDSCRAQIFLSACFMGVFLISLPASAQSSRAGAAIFEPLGARNVGIGNAVTALGDDLSSLHANPAGLSSSDYNEINLDFVRTSAQDVWLGASTATPVGRKATFALGIFGFESSSDANALRSQNDGSIRLYGAPLAERDALIQVAAARLLRPDFSVGAGAKYLRFEESLSNARGGDYEAILADVGFRYNSATSGFVVAGSTRNITLSQRYRNGSEGAPDLPMTSALGVSYGRLQGTAHYVNVSADLVYREDRDLCVRAGTEYWMANLFGVRLGYDGLERGRKWRGGLSLNFHGTMIDLAFIPDRDDWDRSAISGALRFTFGAGRKQ